MEARPQLQMINDFQCLVILSTEILSMYTTGRNSLFSIMWAEHLFAFEIEFKSQKLL